MIKSHVKTIDGEEPVTAYTVEEAADRLPALVFKHRRRNRKTYYYATEYAVLDTETSHVGDVAWIHQWAVKLCGLYIIGRKPSEFIALLRLLKDHYELRADKSILVYIHNSSYDLQYLKHYLHEYDPGLRIMATDPHAVLIADVVGFRILCSYRLSNLSLDLFARNYAARYRKAAGMIDYNVVRYQDGDLTAKEWEYMLSDVAAQHDAIRGFLEARGYQYAYKAPYTSTGFVRTDCRKSSEKSVNWHRKFEVQALDLEQYNLCRQAFMGGVTIASYRYAGSTVRSDHLRHIDFASSYPARQMMDYFPTGRPFWYGDIDDEESFRDALDTFCCCFLATFYGLKIRPGVTAPYVPSSKGIYVKDVLKVNGKVVSAEAFTIALTEIDFAIIERQYTYEDIAVDKVLCFQRGECPRFLKRKIMEYYTAKCTLKKADPRLYQASKANLNSIYGMTATAITRDDYELDGDLIITGRHKDDQAQLDAFYRSRNSFLPYQLGVWTTAHARAALMDMIERIGYGNFLYCDTDSAFYLETDANRRALEEMNSETRERAAAAGAYYEDYVLGVAEPEAPLRAFRALHAKCYAAEEKDGDDWKLKVTIAGIPKRATVWRDGIPETITSAEELGSIDRLEDGFTFRACGGNQVLYVEDVPKVVTIGGHDLETASSAIISPIEKEISETMYTYGKDYSILETQMYQIIE